MASTISWADIQNQPVLPAPDGIVPDLSNPKSRAFEIYVTAAVCLPLIVLFTVLRCYAKIVIMKKWTWDDC